MTRGIPVAILAASLAACAGQDPPPLPPVVGVAASVAATGSPAPVAVDKLTIAQRKVSEMLAKVARARGISATREVPSRLLDRAEVLARIRAKVEQEIPRDVVEHEGELLAALELVPPDYDFVEGTYRLIQGRIAGYYEPKDRTMYLVDDLDDDEADETLAHELDHALQDQAFDLKALLDFVPGEGDRTSAWHAVAEGDAMSAQFDVMLGSAFNVPEAALRKLLSLSNAVAETSTFTPRAMQESLVAPYADGFAFIQERRQHGGWGAVDAAWRQMPESTEQLLHPAKYIAREPPIRVATPRIDGLGAGFRAAMNDVVGEQGLRIMLGEWASEAVSHEAAAGWGGDRYVIARRDDGNGRRTIAVGWSVVMDTERDARELAALLQKKFGAACRERPALGPITWQRKGPAIALAAGPYERHDKHPKSAGTCATAKKWVADILTP